MNNYNFPSLANVNVELTNRCNKNCWMCGRRKIERDFPSLVDEYGDMDFALVEKIAAQLPSNIVVQLHNNGEPTLYPRFGAAVKLFHRQTTNIVTNGKLLVEKADEIIDNLDTLAISIIENDDEADEQYETILEFLSLKKDKKPYTIFRLNGNVETERYEKLGTITRRLIHSPMGSFNYRKRMPTIPEIGICLDFLNHMAINKDGYVSICVRFDPEKKGVIGSCTNTPLSELWMSKKRLEWRKLQVQGRREEIPLCEKCEFWGVPTGF